MPNAIVLGDKNLLLSKRFLSLKTNNGKLMKYKKLILIILSILLCFTSFTACNSGGSSNQVILFALEDENLTITVPGANGDFCAYVDGVKKGSTFTAENGKATLPKFVFNSSVGDVVELKLEFIADNGNVSLQKSYQVDVVDRTISSVKDFNAWYSGYETHYNKNEYVILTEDIILNGGNIDNWRMATWLEMMYNGTFDGRGHTIYNFSSTCGFIPNISKDGCIKNLAMVNMVNTGTSGFVGQWLCGKVENCYFQGKQTSQTGGARFTGFFGRYYDDLHDNGYVKLVKNVVINVKRTDCGAINDAFCDLPSIVPINCVFDNVYMVNDKFSSVFFGMSWDELNVKTYQNVDYFISDLDGVLPLGFSSDFWKINGNGELVFKSVK